MLTILFLCTGNSCRSQMAEAWARELRGSLITPYSAGVNPGLLDQRAVSVMAEIGIDLSHGRPKHVRELADIPFDYVVTVCDHAHETCPLFPGKTKVIHHGFDDPPHLAKAVTTDDQALAIYRRVRDEIKTYIESLPESLTHAAN
jgi:arsenate reductase